jgi:23S rRNA (guanine745-N1)-methyltransferase
MLICPVCDQALIKENTCYTCTRNPPHSFDLSKFGYINLLLPHRKKTLEPGDNLEMIRSRKDFFSQNHYQPIAELLNQHIALKIKDLPFKDAGIVDIGCGEGYYLINLKRSLKELGNLEIKYYGVDISKAAVKKCAKVSKDITWVVASGTNLPLQSSSTGIAISVFAPFTSLSEIHRILKSNGYAFIITPDIYHLYELREAIFSEVKEIKQDKILSNTQDYFSLAQEPICLTYELTLTNPEDISNLFKMTPFYWKCTPDKQKYILSLNHLKVTVAVKLWIFSPKKMSSYFLQSKDS